MIAAQSFTSNVFATLGDLFFLVHDWLFTEQYVAASLLMPIAVSIQSRPSAALDGEKQRAKRTITACNAGFYVLTAAWFGVSIYSGKFVWRTGSNFIFAVVLVTLSVTLFRIKQLIERMNATKLLKTNYWLINVNMLIMCFCVLCQTLILAFSIWSN